jgi:enterochelin esterase-like enzyme
VSQNASGQATVGYRVYLPPCYTSSQRRYPYVFLFHGVDGDQTEWTDILGVNQTLDQGIANHSLPPMILIMPSGGLMEYDNYFTDGQSFESFIVDELLLDVDKRFCTWGDAAGRAIGGISRGGFWSYEIGFRHPALFSAIGGHSAFFDPENAPAAYNPLNLAQTVIFPPGTQPRLWLDAGPDDSVHPEIDTFAQALTDRHIDPGYTLYPTGGHTNDYWMSHMAEYLAFYGLHWPRQVNDLPTCHHAA